MTVKIISGGTVIRGHNYVDARPKNNSNTQSQRPIPVRTQSSSRPKNTKPTIQTARGKTPSLKSQPAQAIQQPAPQRMYIKVNDPKELQGAMQEAYNTLTGRPQPPRNVTNTTTTRRVVKVTKNIIPNVETPQPQPVEVKQGGWLNSITAKIYGSPTNTNTKKKGFLWW